MVGIRRERILPRDVVADPHRVAGVVDPRHRRDLDLDRRRGARLPSVSGEWVCLRILGPVGPLRVPDQGHGADMGVGILRPCDLGVARWQRARPRHVVRHTCWIAGVESRWHVRDLDLDRRRGADLDRDLRRCHQAGVQDTVHDDVILPGHQIERLLGCCPRRNNPHRHRPRGVNRSSFRDGVKVLLGTRCVTNHGQLTRSSSPPWVACQRRSTDVRVCVLSRRRALLGRRRPGVRTDRRPVGPGPRDPVVAVQRVGARALLVLDGDGAGRAVRVGLNIPVVGVIVRLRTGALRAGQRAVERPGKAIGRVAADERVARVRRGGDVVRPGTLGPVLRTGERRVDGLAVDEHLTRATRRRHGRDRCRGVLDDLRTPIRGRARRSAGRTAAVVDRDNVRAALGVVEESSNARAVRRRLVDRNGLLARLQLLVDAGLPDILAHPHFVWVILASG